MAGKRRHKWCVAGDRKRSIFAHCSTCGVRRYKFVAENVYRYIDADGIARKQRIGVDPVPPCPGRPEEKKP